MITHARLKELFEYDPKRGIFTRKVLNTNALRTAGSIGPNGYLSLFADGRAYKAHRMAWLYVYGEMPSTSLDHINGDRADNRIENLRLATRSQNSQNIGSAYKNNRGSGILGVYPHVCGKWQARIQVNKKAKSLGLFLTKEEAAAAYRLAKAKFHPFAARL